MSVWGTKCGECAALRPGMRERKMIVSREKNRMVTRRNLHTKSAVRKDCSGQARSGQCEFLVKDIEDYIQFSHFSSFARRDGRKIRNGSIAISRRVWPRLWMWGHGRACEVWVMCHINYHQLAHVQFLQIRKCPDQGIIINHSVATRV